jgi:hypothetical protein
MVSTRIRSYHDYLHFDLRRLPRFAGLGTVNAECGMTSRRFETDIDIRLVVERRGIDITVHVDIATLRPVAGRLDPVGHLYSGLINEPHIIGGLVLK